MSFTSPFRRHAEPVSASLFSACGSLEHFPEKWERGFPPEKRRLNRIVSLNLESGPG
jgi:hypothetical protein